LSSTFSYRGREKMIRKICASHQYFFMGGCR
jgi:hypothetical protein